MKQALLAAIEEAIRIYEQFTDYPAIRTRQMIEQKGAIKALSDLALSGDIQKGFKVLANQNQLDKSFESVIITYKELFDPEIVKAAQWRLDNYDKL